MMVVFKVNLPNDILIEKIEETRETMILAGLKLGFTHQDTVRLSTQLDHLLNELHKRGDTSLLHYAFSKEAKVYMYY